MTKLDCAKVEWIVREKRNGTPAVDIARQMGVSPRWVQKLAKRYKTGGSVSFPLQMGRPKRSPPGRRELSAIFSAVTKEKCGAVSVEKAVDRDTEIHIPHNTIHKTLRDSDIAHEQPKKGRRRKWVRYERTYSNSMWHTDYKQLDDGRWFLCYEDDASRFVTGYGVFEHATTENALAVLDEAIKNHGKPASILTDRGSQFYASASEAKKKGSSEFEKRLVELGIKQILARVNHPQTNGKIERLHGTLQRSLPRLEASSVDKTRRGGGGADAHVGGPLNTEPKRDAVGRFIEIYNYERAHQSLDWDNQETPAQAFVRKMPPKDKIVVDEQTGEKYATK
jgi:putative transposase